jgi:hypothetical protein
MTRERTGCSSGVVSLRIGSDSDREEVESSPIL